MKVSTIAVGAALAYVAAPFTKGFLDAKGIAQDYTTLDAVVKTLTLVQVASTTTLVGAGYGVGAIATGGKDSDRAVNILKATGLGLTVGAIANTILIGTAYSAGHAAGKYL